MFHVKHMPQRLWNKSKRRIANANQFSPVGANSQSLTGISNRPQVHNKPSLLIRILSNSSMHCNRPHLFATTIPRGVEDIAPYKRGYVLGCGTGKTVPYEYVIIGLHLLTCDFILTPANGI